MRALSALTVLLVLAGPAAAQDERSETTWTELRPTVLGDRPIRDGAGLVSLEAPKRAEDAAIVPVTLRVALPEGDARRVKSLTLVVDENPAPVVGTFRFAQGQRRFDLSTRIRVNSYSYLRAIAETEDGALYMTKTYVKAAGGCSAPAVKDPAEAKAHLGEMRFRAFADRGEAQVQVRHPNYSGLQMDQLTRLYTPAWFVESLSVRQGDTPLFSMTGGISISEDPTFRFTFAGTTEPVTVAAKDTEGKVFTRTFPVGGS
ncbi:quinoprotein dehydrogenase-associated SoxYZ-like carrier [Methylobacterium nonmethylotrophicum]|uniref:Quinoprotein dehydrogenase-associated SoxYZ-like carrier n=1 Tax=Methylobacterium nonmethylotrophicum TaxID=1141884 RepID=A0A4Z0NE54_9HYPH|nr:quinoprotein dehydrogenase-associated SoxYZ-like carrier [Methylobacterium nonmethylotrophicum]TGD91498.1 quinoprotein dehydrogenase-associated SoxYZ-like carrier [Methylobacterium nonmethylotrophicum]